MAGKTHRNVRVEKPEYGVLSIWKSRGELTVENITDVLRDMGDESHYVLFIRATRFDGYLGEDHLPSNVVIHDIEAADNCPACGKSLEAARNSMYESAFQDGFAAGKAARDNPDE